MVQLSIIIPVDNAPLNELAVPISSLNNQLGIDHQQLEVLLVDNGEFHLDSPERLMLFSHLQLRTITLPTVGGRMTAFAAGVAAAKGRYVMLLDANNQLYQPFTVQALLGIQAHHPETDLLGGTTLLQGMTRERQSVYRAGRNLVSLHGMLIRRALLMTDQVIFDDRFGEFSEELAARLLRQAAGGVVETEELVSVSFASRTHGLFGREATINASWLAMMAAYLRQLREKNPEHFTTEYAKFIIRFYSQILHVPGADRLALTTIVADLVKTYAQTWPAAAEVIAAITAQDDSPEAPWVADPSAFSGYLAQLARIAAGRAKAQRTTVDRSRQ